MSSAHRIKDAHHHSGSYSFIALFSLDGELVERHEVGFYAPAFGRVQHLANGNG